MNVESMVAGMELETRGGGDGGRLPGSGGNIHAALSAVSITIFPADVISPVFYRTENHSAPPDVTSYTSSSTTSERTPGAGTAAQKQTPKYGNAELMETGDGEPRLAVLVPSSCLLSVCEQ